MSSSWTSSGAAGRDANREQSDIAIVGSDLKIVDSEQELLEPYAKFREEPINALQELGLHVLGTAWRSYDKILGQEIFYPGFSEQIKEKVLKQPKLREKIRELAKKRVEVELEQGLLGKLGVDGENDEDRGKRLARRTEIETQLLGVAEDWTDKMICKMDSRYFIRGAYYLATQLVTRAYHQGIHVSSSEVLQLRQVAEDAAKKKQSIIFLPCHRSHVDYVSLQLICYRLGLALPIVVAGDNLNFPLVGPFLQHAGAMWIRRSFGDDQMYTTLVQSYIDTLLQNGHNFECFVEGGRSRTGKLLQPKFGILSFLLESVLSGRVEDAIVCPVSTQYDKVIEVDSYISELLGQSKKKEDLASFLSASNVLSLKLGRVDVRFHKPWSLREFVEAQRARLLQRSLGEPDSGSTLNETTLKRSLLSTMGYKVLLEINEASVIMPTALVGTVLLTLSGRSVGRTELLRRVLWLTDRIRNAGGRVAHFAESTVEGVVDKALGVLGPQLVGRIEDLPEEMYYAEDRFQLSFYRNMTIHLFISQALVCASMYTKVKLGGGPDKEKMSYKELYDYTYFLSQLFRAEFIFPTTPFEENLQSTLTSLVNDRVLSVSHSEDGKIDTISIHPEERALDLENFDFYNFLLWPFVEASWLGAIAVFMLAPPPAHASSEAWLDLKTFQDKAQLLGKTLYHRGDLVYYEAVNKESLKNAISRSEEEGIIIVTKPTKDSKAPQRVRLNSEWMPSRDREGRLIAERRLWAFCEYINLSRRDGEGTKEGATVRRRILGLASVVGEEMFEEAVSEANGVQTTKIRRRQGIRTGKESRL
ncbi:Glycerol-3-phosphate acyltransferase [Lecanosticta acicola]|uniref:Glycerol-3-phosphate acyltransferase n=1 Tax=Lecanosticta acicola TaxID=111012 RepID=A0AAI8YVS0_9PEZI|nr:Glycerol-3-phosphate acyltransferase [Lecanosticta acicola]